MRHMRQELTGDLSCMRLLLYYKKHEGIGALPEEVMVAHSARFYVNYI